MQILSPFQAHGTATDQSETLERAPNIPEALDQNVAGRLRLGPIFNIQGQLQKGQPIKVRKLHETGPSFGRLILGQMARSFAETGASRLRLPDNQVHNSVPHTNNPLHYDREL